MWLQEYGITANMILQTPASFIYGSGSLAEAGFRPDHFLNVETFGTSLKKRGIQSLCAAAREHQPLWIVRITALGCSIDAFQHSLRYVAGSGSKAG